MVDTIRNVAAIVRLKHWIKNGFVFFPVFFAGKIESISNLNLLFLFFSFCLAASAIYVLNDIMDAISDKTHPQKKYRPIASEKISKKNAFILFIVITLFFGLSIALLKHAQFYVIGYFVLNIFYSLFLKKIAIVDVSCIGIGFVLRVLAGGSEAEVYVSHWMIIVTFLLTVSIGFAKRRDDVIVNAERYTVNNSLNGYTVLFLDIAKSISFSITLISYILYSISSEVIARIGSDKLYITSLFVFLGIMRYIQITVVNKQSGSPTDVLWRDRFLQVTLILWIVTFYIIIYGRNI